MRGLDLTVEFAGILADSITAKQVRARTAPPKAAARRAVRAGRAREAAGVRS